jgi:hypothetical protein
MGRAALRREQLASDRIKARYDLANSAGYQEGDQVRLYRPTRARGKSPKVQSSWEGPYKAITRINDVVYGIQRHPTAREWWFTTTDWRRTWGLLGTSSLEEGAM